MKAAGVQAARFSALTLLIGVLVVLLSQFVTAYTLDDPFGDPVATVTLFSKHGPFTTLLALLALVALVWATVTGSRAGAAVIVALGFGVVLIFLIVDLPDVGSTGLFQAPLVGNEDVTGAAAPGLWMELVGGVVIMLAGLALATLGEADLRSIIPRRGTSGGSRSGRDRRRPSGRRAAGGRRS